MGPNEEIQRFVEFVHLLNFGQVRSINERSTEFKNVKFN
jgi:hypothetical protein